MTITAQSGIMGFGLQPAKGTLASTWYRHKALMVGFGPITPKDTAPPEIGGAPNPTGVFKTGAWYAGQATFQPRLEGDFGWLLLGLAGNVVSAANDSTGFTHLFTQKPGLGGASFIPWMSFRRYLPGPDAANDMGDVGLDCLINAMTFNIPQVGPLSVQTAVTGRIPTLDDAPNLWTWADEYEDYDSVPMSMTGHFKLPNFTPAAGASIPATGATVTITNGTTGVDEERVIGSYHPDDFATRQRVLQVQFTHKVNNYDLWRFIFNGGDPAEGGFKPCIQFSDFEVMVESPCDIEEGVTNFPWQLSIRAPKVSWEAGPVQLEGDSIISQQYTGLAVEADTGLPEDYFEIELRNTQASYPLPV
jgi:hypothetical protein